MKIAGIITMIVSLIISIVSGYCTVVGMGKVFASAAYVTMFIATVIEIGRVILLYDLHHFWSEMGIVQKVPGICMLLISITLSAMGIFGFMSNAHSQRTQEVIPIEMKISEKNQQIEILNNAIKINNEQLKQYDGKAFNKYTEMGYVTKAVNLQKEQQKITNSLYDDNRNKQSEITKLNQEILQLKLEAEQKAPTLAHIKYYAKLFNVDNDTAIIIFIVMIMLVFDTLAMYLMITADWINNRGIRHNVWAKKEELLNKFNEEDIAKNLEQLKDILNKCQSQLNKNDFNYDEQFNNLITLIDNLPEKVKQEPLSLDNIEEKLNKLLTNDNTNYEKIVDYFNTNTVKMNDYNKQLTNSTIDKILAINNQINGLRDNILSINNKEVSIKDENLTKKLDKIESKVKQIGDNTTKKKKSKEVVEKNIDRQLKKLVSLIDDNESIIESKEFQKYIWDNTYLVDKLKENYKNNTKILDKLNKI